MAYDIDSVIDSVRASRQFFLKHLKGVQDDQWDWKPYPKCKSIRETLAHLIADDRACLSRLDNWDKSDYEAFGEHETDVSKLPQLLDESHERYCAFVKSKFADTPLDQEVEFFMGRVPLAEAIKGISSEDYYHAGQVAFIRMANDPSWKYYAEIYGWE